MGRRRNSKYILPRDAYMKTLWTIRAYYRYQAEVEAILSEQASQDGQPHGSGFSDPTPIKAAKLTRVMDNIRAIEQGFAVIPPEYRDGILKAIIDRKPYPDIANRKTWAKWRQRYVYEVARLIGEV